MNCWTISVNSSSSIFLISEDTSMELKITNLFPEFFFLFSFLNPYSVPVLWSKTRTFSFIVIGGFRDCPNDINEAVSSLIYASARCGDLPELRVIRKLFGERYGQRFAVTAVELFPGNLVNREVIICNHLQSKLMMALPFIQESFVTNMYEWKLMISKPPDKRETLHEFSTRWCEE